jgi:hypothetical protein
LFFPMTIAAATMELAIWMSTIALPIRFEVMNPSTRVAMGKERGERVEKSIIKISCFT